MPDDKPAHILVVDDDPMIADLIETYLRDLYHVASTDSGLKAIEMAINRPPDLILLDIMLGDARGYDICQLLKSNPLTRKIPVIFISSLAESLDKVKAFNVGGLDYVTKPIALEELRVRIHTHITLSRLQRNLEQTIGECTEELEKSNSALRSSLEHREAEIRSIEETIMTRVKKFISPYLDKLEQCNLGKDALVYLEIIRSNFKELIPSSANTLSANYIKLTPSEVKVADLIRLGQQTKQIADHLNLSTKSVFYYRNNIRKKLGLLNTKVNLTSYLESLNHKDR